MIKNKFLDLSQLTLVMPTCRRQDYAIRNMQYWSKTNATLLVLDDSPEPIKDNIIRSFGNNIIYKHDTSEYILRIVNSYSKIKTEYTQLISDDEFYITSAVRSCIEELEKDDSLISCNGCCLKFIVDKENNQIYSKHVYHRLYNYYTDTMKEDSVKRLYTYMENYVPVLMYGVIRTDIWKIAFELPVMQINFFASDELQISMYLAFVGKSKIIRELLWLRSFGEHLSIREEFSDRIEPPKTMEKWWHTDLSERENFIKKMNEIFNEIIKSKNIKAKDIVENSCNQFIKGGGSDGTNSNHHRIKEKYGILIFYLMEFIKKIKLLIPYKIKDFIKNLNIWKKSKMSFLNGAESLKKMGIKVNTVELIEIKRIIEHFHSK